MFNYFQQFNKLPKDLRDKISTKIVMDEIDKLERKYKIGLAVVVMKIMVKSISRKDLPAFFIEEFNLSIEDAKGLSNVLYEKVLNNVADYLNIDIEPKRRDVELDTKHELAPPPPAIILKDKKVEKTRDFAQEKEDVVDEIGSKLEELFKSSEKKEEEKPVEAEAEIGSLLEEVTKEKKEIRITKEELAKEGFIKEGDIKGELDGIEKEFVKPKKEVVKNVLSEDFGDRIERKIDQIITELDIKFGSEDLLSRFKNILSTYLRGVRSKIDTKNTLNKSFGSGGMNFDDEAINKVFKVTNKIESEEQKVLEEEIRRMSKSVDKKIFDDKKSRTKTTEADYNLLDSLKEQNKIEEVKDEKEVKKPLPETKELPITPVVKKEKIEDAKIKALPKKEPVRKEEELKKDLPIKEIKKVDKQIVEKKEKKEEEKKVIQPQTGKLRMEDIRKAPRVMGPIDELRYLGLTDFRRLTQDPVEMTQKIKEKIGLLEEESYGKMIDGILAWRHSPVNKLYLETAYQGISSGMKIEDVIKQREKEDKEFLNMEEIDALINLNKELMF